MENPNIVILDVSSPAEFNGVDVRAKSGRNIPWSVNVEWKSASNLKGNFKSAGNLLGMYRGECVITYKEVITFCQTGHRAAQGYFTM